MIACRECIELRAVTNHEAEQRITPCASLLERNFLLLTEDDTFDHPNKPFNLGSPLPDTRDIRCHLIRNFKA